MVEAFGLGFALPGLGLFIPHFLYFQLRTLRATLSRRLLLQMPVGMSYWLQGRLGHSDLRSNTTGTSPRAS